MPYELVINPSLKKTLSKIDAEMATKIREKIRGLADNPRPSACKKMEGEKNTYQLRVGVYRVLYEIHDKKLLILVLNVGHRKEIYKRKS